MLDIHTYRFIKTKYGPELLIDLYIKHDDWGLTIPHRLDYYEICLIKKARGTVYLDYKPFELSPQTILFTPPGPVRKWQVEDDFHVEVLIFPSDFIDAFFSDSLFLYKLQYFHQPGNQRLALGVDDFRGLEDAFDEMYTEIGALQKDSVHLLRAMLYRMLIRLNRLYGRVYQLDGDTGAASLSQQLRLLVDRHFRQIHRVDAYADMLSLTPGHLNEKVRKQTGSSVSELIRNRILAETKRLLLHSGLNIAEIADHLGFLDPSYFVRYFKKYEGCTPLRYRLQTEEFYHTPPNIEPPEAIS